MTKQQDIANNISQQAHLGQTRRDGTDYIFHVINVVKRLDVYEDDELTAIAWLHDVVEDTRVTLGELRLAGLTDRVINGVGTMTHRGNERYEDYIYRVKTNPDAVKVKLADIQDNISDAPTERQMIKYARAILLLLTGEQTG